MGHCTRNGVTAVWQPEPPHHLFFKAEFELFLQEGTKEPLKQIIPKSP